MFTHNKIIIKPKDKKVLSLNIQPQNGPTKTHKNKNKRSTISCNEYYTCRIRHINPSKQNGDSCI